MKDAVGVLVASRLPVVRAIAIAAAAEGESEEAEPLDDMISTLIGELEQIRRLEAVQASRHSGWRVESQSGSSVILAASLGDEGVSEAVSRAARSLRQLSERDFAYRLALSGLFLLPRDEKSGLCVSASPGATEPGFLSLFDEGCCLLDQVNANGLLVAAGEEQADMVACWLSLRVLTGLQTALDRTPPNATGAYFDTFGLATWEFPLEPLTTCLAHRWQREKLEWLLEPPTGERGAVAPFLEQHGQAGTPWPEKTLMRFRVTGEAWARPALHRVRSLRSEIDEAVEAERERLNVLIAQGGEWFDEMCAETQEALAAEVDALLDGPGLGATESFLAKLEQAAQSHAARLERDAGRGCARAQELDEAAGEAGRTLDDLAARFLPFRPRALLGLLTHPWRLLRLWLLYHEIGQCSGVYLAYRQNQWLLRAEAGEQEWQSAFYARLAQAAGVESEAAAQLRTRLERLHDSLAPNPALKQALARRLESAALPPELAGYFYRRVTGGGQAAPARLLAVYGPLSRWMREGWEAETLGHILAEHAQEQFAFLAQVRLDELLTRTYSGAELRRRLAALVEAAVPWWAYDESASSAEERARIHRLLLVGLPDADSSLLVDLLPDRPLSCFSTSDRHQIVAIQVMQGFQVNAQA